MLPVETASAVDHGGRQRQRRSKAVRAATQTVPSARTSRHGPARDEAPNLTRSEEGQGRGVGSRRTTRPSSRSHPPPPLPPRRSSSSCSRTRKTPAVPGHPVWVSRGATGEGPAVHRWPACRRRTHGGDSGHSWVAGEGRGGSGGGGADVPSVEQAVAVPMISLDWLSQRSAIRRPQKAEQLVEVPMETGYSLAVVAVKSLGRRAAAALAEQIVDNPVLQVRRGSGGGLQGSLPVQNPAAFGRADHVEIPAPRVGGLQRFPPEAGFYCFISALFWCCG